MSAIGPRLDTLFVIHREQQTRRTTVTYLGLNSEFRKVRSCRSCVCRALPSASHFEGPDEHPRIDSAKLVRRLRCKFVIEILTRDGFLTVVQDSGAPTAFYAHTSDSVLRTASRGTGKHALGLTTVPAVGRLHTYRSGEPR